MRLNGQRIAITGASSGIGAEMASLASSLGATVILLARSVDKLESLAAALPGPSIIKALDVTDGEQVNQVFATLLEDGPIDVLINNAGFGKFENVLDATFETDRAMMDVNYFGLIRCVKAVLPAMVARKKGHIINVASMAGKMGFPQTAGYAATKHAVLGYTNSLRLELAAFSDIHVTAINPGPIRTNFFDIADPSGNYLKGLPQWFILQPAYVAKRVIGAIVKPKDEIMLPRTAAVAILLAKLLPAKLVAKMTQKH
jgi:short-subunit dehydrogenase